MELNIKMTIFKTERFFVPTLKMFDICSLFTQRDMGLSCKTQETF